MFAVGAGGQNRLRGGRSCAAAPVRATSRVAKRRQITASSCSRNEVEQRGPAPLIHGNRGSTRRLRPAVVAFVGLSDLVEGVVTRVAWEFSASTFIGHRSCVGS